MKQYRTVNNLMGWLTFIIAATVYCLTIEPTASFWDCPEFITTGYKLEVGHPPGAPFFMLMANLFTQFASDVTTVAKMVNYMSALMSGACILFLFWSITHLVRKLIITDENNITKGQLITVMGSGLIGALVYTFSDTFWFSAVEGEVLDAVMEKLPGFPIVLHGSSSVPQEEVETINKYGGALKAAIGIPEEELRKAAKSAVCKINIDSDSRLAMTAAIRQTFAEKPAEFDPRKYLGPARDNMEKLYKHKIINVLGSDNKLAE